VKAPSSKYSVRFLLSATKFHTSCIRIMKITHPDVTCSYTANSFKIECETNLPGQKMFYKIFATRFFVSSTKRCMIKKKITLVLRSIIPLQFTIAECQTSRHQIAPNCTIIFLRIFGVTKHSL